MAACFDEYRAPNYHHDKKTCSCALCITSMTRRQYFSSNGPGSELRFFQSDYNMHTDQVESDELYEKVRG